MFKKIIFLFICLGFIQITLHAQLVGKAEGGVFLLENAEIYTITQGVIKGSVLLKDGKIAAVGEQVDVPAAAKRINCTGKRIYPGFIDSGTTLGLKEIGSISLSKDSDEIGSYNTHMKALTALNPNSILIPVTRVNGVTTVLTKPEGGIFSGTASLVDLWGYTPEQMYAGFTGMVMNFPRDGKRGWWDRRKPKKIKADYKKKLKEIDEFISKAKQYKRIYDSNKGETLYNPQLEAMRPIIEGKQSIIMQCNSKEDVLQAIAWSKKHDLKIILSGVKEGYMIADSIHAADVPVITGPVLSNPTRSSEGYDTAYKNAMRMKAAGIPIALQTNENENVRNLNFHAGFAAAYGLGVEEALKAVTINAAKNFGVEDMYGSIEVGKRANLFICDGDPFEPKTTIEQVFIRGWKIPMESRHSLLYDEFIKRNPGIED